jgi:hypothetical protein
MMFFILQEMMGARKNLVEDLGKLCKYWEFLAIDVNGSSRGLIPIWKTRNILLLNSFVIAAGIYIDLQGQELGYNNTMINYYGPYEDRKTFGDFFFSKRS